MKDELEALTAHGKRVAVFLDLAALAAMTAGIIVSSYDWKRFDYLFALVAYIGGNLIEMNAAALRARASMETGK